MRGVRVRRPRGRAEWSAAAVVAVAGIVLLARLTAAALAALAAAWPTAVALLLVAAAAAAWRIRRAAARRRRDRQRLTRLRITLAEFDAMDDRGFEYALRDLLIRDGWPSHRVGGGGDQAADVIADHPQRGRIVVQAKHTRVAGKVGSAVMYGVKGTAGPVHGARYAVVVTNGAFTRDAMTWGDRHGVHWIDRDRLNRWAHTGAALHELIGLPARPRPLRFRGAA
ncbi:restriction endonuclease [Streptomyces phaeofaciens]|uniref:restriction endonuclease n=1 Tax=Streptomyces phaeofaciens TaxID=68254 RepID=UPI0036822C22